MKNENGVLSVEATVSLSVFVFFMMFILNFGQIFMAQNLFHHRLLQAGKMISFYSYDYKNYNAVETLWADILSWTNFSVGIEAEWINQSIAGDDDYSEGVLKAFNELSSSIDSAKPSELMKKYGIDNINIIALKNDSDLDIDATYDVNLYFRILGIKKISMHQSVKCGLWS